MRLIILYLLCGMMTRSLAEYYPGKLEEQVQPEYASQSSISSDLFFAKWMNTTQRVEDICL